jgi:hypothetical protein
MFLDCVARRDGVESAPMSKKPRGRPKEPTDVPKTTLHAEIPLPLKQRFKAIADANGRKITAELIRIMEKHVAQYEQKRAEGRGTDE